MKIHNFEFSGFRSLHHVTPGNLANVTAFHGENNTGKSNLLAALAMVFQEKLGEEEAVTDSGSEPRPTPRPTPFYYGRIPNFADNFEWRSNDPVSFRVKVEADNAELEALPGFASIPVKLVNPGHKNYVEIVGKILPIASDGDMFLEEARLNKTILYHRGHGAAPRFFPAMEKQVAEESRQEAAESVLFALTNLVHVIGSDRFLTAEPSEGVSDLTPQSFKRWLHKLSLSRERFGLYHGISEAFGGVPFNFGEIGFAEADGSLEIMVRNPASGLRLPIGRLGTGVQQVLVLLAQILQRRASVVAIEELELNLSYRNQDLVLNKLIALVQDASFPVSQLLLTTHSDHLGSRSDVKQYCVGISHGQTFVRTFTTSDRTALFPRGRGKRAPFVFVDG